MSACSFFTIALGVPERTTMPYHEVTSKPASPLSATVGTSGSCGERRGLAIASATSLPERTCCSTVEIPANIICPWPPSRSLTAGAMPL